MRAVELVLGIPVPGVQLSSQITTGNFTAAITAAANTNANDLFNDEVRAALQDAAPILIQMAIELAVPAIFDFRPGSINNQRQPLTTKYVVSLLFVLGCV